MVYQNCMFFHLEIKSKKDAYMPVRILNYTYAEIHQHPYINKKIRQLMPVCCLTVYLGKGAWTKRKQLSECVKLQKYVREIQDYEIGLFALNTEPI